MKGEREVKVLGEGREEGKEGIGNEKRRSRSWRERVRGTKGGREVKGAREVRVLGVGREEAREGGQGLKEDIERKHWRDGCKGQEGKQEVMEGQQGG